MGKEIKYEFIAFDIDSTWIKKKTIGIMNINSKKKFNISQQRLSKLAIKFGFEKIFTNRLSDVV